jgi:enamine deaminase RidA (YjgF/YER057c/UK114 family)
VTGTPIRTWTFPPGMGVPEPSGAYAHATAYGSTLYVTGQLPIDPVSGLLVDGDIVVQTNQVMVMWNQMSSEDDPNPI